MRICRVGPISALLVAVLTAGCATAPVYPLMTPIAVTQTFGYYEKPADGGKYQVSYVTPPLQALGYRFDTTPTTDSAKVMAVDLATLRAAQLAQQSGWQGFDIVDRHTSSDAEFKGGYWDNDFGYGGGWGWHDRFWGGWGGWSGGWGGPGWSAGAGGPGWYEPPEQRIQAEAVLTISFTNNLKSGDVRAADIVQQMTGRYPGLTGPVATTPAAPAAPKRTA